MFNGSLMSLPEFKQNGITLFPVGKELWMVVTIAYHDKDQAVLSSK